MQDWYWFFNIAFPLARWAHIVCTTLIVGGVLFYEFVVPAAIEDLPEPQQFAVLGKVRWVYRRIVVASVLLLIASGLVTILQLWNAGYKSELHDYRHAQILPWAIAHMVLGLIALAICWALTTRKKIPHQPMLWLRMSLMILLITIFLADVSRHIRLRLREPLETPPRLLTPRHGLRPSMAPLTRPSTQPP